MKKTVFCAYMALTLMMTSCNTDEPTGELPVEQLAVLTFEDSDVAFTPYIIEGCGKTISLWSHLVDEQQYGGALLYNDYSFTGYRWCDEGNTELASGIVGGGVFWNGGHAISHYYNPDCTTSTFETQLEVSVGSEGAAGHNGSRHFAVHNGYVDESSYKTKAPGFYFADGVERTIKCVYVVNTSYVYNSLRYGDAFSPAATSTTWYKITATGYNAADEMTGKSEFLLCNGCDNIVSDWTCWNLESLGSVAKVEFNLSASDDLVGQFGLTVPAYFAYDDVTVIMSSTDR